MIPYINTVQKIVSLLLFMFQFIYHLHVCCVCFQIIVSMEPLLNKLNFKIIIWVRTPHYKIHFTHRCDAILDTVIKS